MVRKRSYNLLKRTGKFPIWNKPTGNRFPIKRVIILTRWFWRNGRCLCPCWSSRAKTARWIYWRSRNSRLRFIDLGYFWTEVKKEKTKTFLNDLWNHVQWGGWKFRVLWCHKRLKQIKKRGSPQISLIFPNIFLNYPLFHLFFSLIFF